MRITRKKTRPRLKTRKYKNRRNKWRKTIRRGGENTLSYRNLGNLGPTVAQRRAALGFPENKNKTLKKNTKPVLTANPQSYSKVLQERRRTLKQIGKKNLSASLEKPLQVEAASPPPPANLPITYKSPPKYSSEKKSTPPLPVKAASPPPPVKATETVEPTRRILVRGANVKPVPVLPGYTEALNAIKELDLFLEAAEKEEKPLSRKSSQRKPLSPTISAEIVDKIQNPILSNEEVNNNIFNLIVASVPVENRKKAEEFSATVNNMINEESTQSASIRSASIRSAIAGPPLSVKKEKKVRRNIFKMWRNFIKGLRLGKKGISVKRSGAVVRGMASIRGLTIKGTVVENPIKSASLESTKSSGSPSRYGSLPVYASARRNSNPEYANVNQLVEVLTNQAVERTPEETMDIFMKSFGPNPELEAWEAHKSRVKKAEEEADQFTKEQNEIEIKKLIKEAEIIKLRQLTALKKALRTQGEYIEIGSQEESPEEIRKSRRPLPESIRRKRKEKVISEIEQAYEEYIKNLEEKNINKL